MNCQDDNGNTKLSGRSITNLQCEGLTEDEIEEIKSMDEDILNEINNRNDNVFYIYESVADLGKDYHECIDSKDLTSAELLRKAEKKLLLLEQQHGNEMGILCLPLRSGRVLTIA